MYDVVIVGGGPAGLSAALYLGRGRKRVLLCDAGEPRNQAATHVHGFLTRDGTPPQELRRLGREQLAPYDVEHRAQHVEAIRGERDDFVVTVGGREERARRVLLSVGMIDELPALPGYRELWGKAIFQCPYCHGWEIQDRAFGYLCTSPEWMEFPFFLKGWSHDLTVFTDARFEPSDELRGRLHEADIGLEERAIVGLRMREGGAGGSSALAAVQLAGGLEREREFLFARPPQRQCPLVGALDLKLDEQGFVVTDPMTRQTSRAGIYAAGDLTTMMQGAVMAAQAGAVAAAMLNHELTVSPLVRANEAAR